MKFYVSFLTLVGSHALGLYLGGAWVWLGVFMNIVAIPLADTLAGQAAAPKERGDGGAYDVALLLVFPTLAVFMAFAVWSVQGAGPVVFWGTMLSTGFLMNFVGVVAAHELVHRSAKFQRWMGYATLMLVNFGHFAVEHVFVHHKWVATPKDPASAKKGESLYSFWIQSFYKGFFESYRYESRRLAGKPALRRLASHRVRNFALVTTVASAVVLQTLGWSTLLFWWGASLTAILYLETANYVEHYGLQRRPTKDGQYEPVTPAHSWDCDYTVTNAMTYNLGYHSYHHTKPLVHYQKLETHIGPRKLPCAFGPALLMALVPPLWFRVMDPLVEAERERNAAA